MLRPPTPNMQGQELVQWFQRVYDAIRNLEQAIGDVPAPISSHNDLTDNGGVNYHQFISQHMAGTSAHGTISKVVGETDLQTLTNKTINALNNTLAGLRHGIEVDQPPVAHGTASPIVGESDSQTLTNKTIDAANNTLSGLKHGFGVDQPPIAHGTASPIVGESDPQILSNKVIHRKVRTMMAGGMLTDDDDLIRVFEINLIITLPVAPTGRTYTIENSALGTCEIQTIDGKLIQGESNQVLPMGSSVDLVFNGMEWRFI